MNQFILLLAILLQFTSCNQEKIDSIEINNSSQIEKKDTSVKLKFTSGIRSIFEDSKGNYWFGSLQEGVAVHNKKEFTYFTIEDGLASNQVLSIQEDKNGNIWFGTNNGVCSYDGKTITNHNPTVNYDAENEWLKTSNDLWFNAGIKEGIYRYNGQKLNYLAFPNPKVINPYNVYSVTSISKGKNGMLWMATYAGVFGYNGNDFTIINDETLGLQEETGQLHIRSILEDSKGRLWIGNNGIGVLLKEHDTIVNFSEKQNLIHPTSAMRSTSQRGDKSQAGTLEHVFTIAEDADGNIWFGDRDAGIWKYDGQTMKNYTKNEELTNQHTLAIYKDKNNELWFGMADGSVFKFNGKTFDQEF